MKHTKPIKIDSEGPEEISNCPDIQPRRLHSYIRSVNPKREIVDETKRRVDKNDDYVASTPFDNNGQEKWFYNKNDNGPPKLRPTIEGKYKYFT